jgi:hypothetical protein
VWHDGQSLPRCAKVLSFADALVSAQSRLFALHQTLILSTNVVLSTACSVSGSYPPRSVKTAEVEGKAHQLKHLGIAGRRVLVDRKWSNKTLGDHRAERGQFVQQLLLDVGIQPAHGPQDGPYQWEHPAPTDPDVPSRPVLLLHAVAERQRWKAEYTAAQLATSGSPPGNRSATDDQAA